MLSRYFKLKLEKLGFSEVSEVLYSLSYCQGDGCSFEAKLVRMKLYPSLTECMKTGHTLLLKDIKTYFCNMSNLSLSGNIQFISALLKETVIMFMTIQ